MGDKLKKIGRSVVAACAVMVAFAVNAENQPVVAQATDWQQHGEALRTRLVAAPIGMQEANTILLAWEAELAPGWKTYWRSPGEAGLPVELFNAGAQVELMYPVPERFELFDIETFGYGKRVVLPFKLEGGIDDPKKLDAKFMVCKEICIPFNTSYTVDNTMVDAAGLPQELKIKEWLAKVPARITDKETQHGLKVEKVRVLGPKGSQRLVIDVRSDTRLDGVDLLVEGVPGVHFTKPQVRLTGSGETARLVLQAVSGRAAVDLKGTDVRLTLVESSGRAVDQTVALVGGAGLYAN